MEHLTYREEPRTRDIETVSAILRTSGFFNPEEVEVGVSLIEERLHKGIDSDYFFQFQEKR